ncbi:MAG: flippase-like domain-containing protein [Endomicrobium sp.]|nr:flippase-like domain-containing protein [Endomicrobium sp.]
MKILVGICVSIVFIWLTLHQIDIKKLFEFTACVKYFVLIPGVLVYVFTYILRSVRYYYILLSIKKTKVLDNFPYTVVGFFANNIIPLRLGDLIRAKITGEYLCVSRSSVFATIVIERLFDIITFVLFFFLIVRGASFPEFIKKYFYILTFVFFICLSILYIILTHKDKTLKILSKMPIPLTIKSFITAFLNRFTFGLIVFKKPSILVKSFIFSGILWITEALFIVIVAYACGIHISIFGGIFTVIIIGTGSIIPTAPGYFGAFEFMGVLALSILYVDKDLAFVCMTICHFLQLAVIFILGGLCILKTKITFSDLFKFAKNSK